MTVGGGLLGNEKLKIGELAKRTGVTKRTIDYYTKLDLLKVERSSSNYRYYSSDMIQLIEEIELKKSQGMSLEEIKKSMNLAYAEDIDLHELRLRIQLLEKDVSLLVQQLDQTNEGNKQLIKKKISTESVALMQALLLLIP